MIDLSAAKTVEFLAAEYIAGTAALDVEKIAQLATKRIEEAIAERDVLALLSWFDNKGLLSVASQAKGTTVGNFEQWIVRAMHNDTVPAAVSSDPCGTSYHRSCLVA